MAISERIDQVRSLDHVYDQEENCQLLHHYVPDNENFENRFENDGDDVVKQ